MDNVCFIGESNIGAKTSLIRRIVDNEYHQDILSTIGIDYENIRIKLSNSHIISLRLWDTAGQERFRIYLKNYLSKARGIIIGYDITNEDSFKQAKHDFYEKAIQIGNNPIIYLIGNKIDLIEERKVSIEEGFNFAKEKKIKFFEVSGEGIYALLEELSNDLMKKFPRLEKINKKYENGKLIDLGEKKKDINFVHYWNKIQIDKDFQKLFKYYKY